MHQWFAKKLSRADKGEEKFIYMSHSEEEWERIDDKEKIIYQAIIRLPQQRSARDNRDTMHNFIVIASL